MSFGAARLATEKADFRPALLLSILPGITEMQMGTKLSYGEQLKHPNWQRKRLEALESSDFACDECGDKDNMLHVHHLHYVKGRMAWEYENEELAVLCEKCHKNEHEQREFLDRMILAASQQGMLSSVIAVVVGHLAGAVVVGPNDAKEAIEIDGHSYHLGILSSIARGADWNQMAKAARAVNPRGLFSPAEEQAVALWESEKK